MVLPAKNDIRYKKKKIFLALLILICVFTCSSVVASKSDVQVYKSTRLSAPGSSVVRVSSIVTILVPLEGLFLREYSLHGIMCPVFLAASFLS